MVETLAWPSHSWTLAMSASWESALVAAVARRECTHNPFTSALMPVARPYFRTMLWQTEPGSSGRSNSPVRPVRLFVAGGNTRPAASAPWPATARYSSISRCTIACMGTNRILPRLPLTGSASRPGGSGCRGPASRTTPHGACRDRAGWPGWRDRARP